MHWTDIDIKKIAFTYSTLSLGLKKAFNLKYGDFNYTNDIRQDNILFATWLENFLKDKSKSGASTVLLTGANKGEEVSFFKEFDLNITAVDISKKALNKLKKKHPTVETKDWNINKLDQVVDSSFDIYASFRTLQSYGVSLEESLCEAIRVTNDTGSFIFSIPTKVRIMGKIQSQLWNPITGRKDSYWYYEMSERIKSYLESRGIQVQIKEVTSEILIFGEK